MKHAVVTGGAGFIGSWLCDKLLENGMKVTCIDNMITGSNNNISAALKNKNFVFMKADVTKPQDIKGPVDYIFHFASPASTKFYQKYPIETILANSIGTMNMVKLAHEKKAKLIMASTSEIYGNPTEHPQKETYWGNVNTVGPRSCYDESKRFAESYIYSFAKQYGLKSVILRIFNTYGPRMSTDDGRVIPNIINQAITGKDVTVYGDGNQTRSFCYVSDTVEGIIMLAMSDATGVFNIGNTEEYKIIDIAKIIIKHIGSKSRIGFQKIPEEDPERRRPDISKISSLGWAPKTDFNTGIKITIDYYKKLL